MWCVVRCILRCVVYRYMIHSDVVHFIDLCVFIYCYLYRVTHLYCTLFPLYIICLYSISHICISHACTCVYRRCGHSRGDLELGFKAAPGRDGGHTSG